MQVGAIFPTTEIGTDAGAIRAFAQGVEGLGFSHLLCYDHVLGADTRNRPDWSGRYALDDAFHEPFVLLSHVAAVTTSLGLVTGVIVLPQRQTALVAKQAAALDLLSEGRLRLGVGVGWNAVEYEALGMPFTQRGARLEEQVGVLRSLWTERAVRIHGRFDRVHEAGINPLPVQRPIPIWFGGGVSTRSLERIGRLADGWIPLHRPDGSGQQALEAIHAAARAAGREPRAIGIEGRLWLDASEQDRWLEVVESWRAFGAAYVTCHTMGNGLSGPDAHLERLRELAESVPLTRSAA